MIVEVALPLPLRQTFDYEWPDDINIEPTIGLRVIVPFGPHIKSGVLVNIKSSSTFSKLKKIHSVLDVNPLFSQQKLKFTRWIAEYYYCGWGEVLNCAIPGGLGIRLQTNFQRTNELETLSDFYKLSPIITHFLKEHPTWNSPDLDHLKINENDVLIIDKWIKKKEITKSQIFIGTKTKPKMERWLRLTEATIEIKKSSKRKQTKREKILLLLQESHEISLPDLKNYVPQPSAVIKKLKEENLIDIFEKRIYRRFLRTPLPSQTPFKNLNVDQLNAFHTIQSSLDNNSHQTFILHGVTGSGKTEVYLHAVRSALALNKQCLILVPEISLTPQLIDHFRSRFGDQIAVIHSGMDDGERFDEWSKIKQGEAQIAIGARSAVFAPFDNIGLIVVDEEHDPSYKQEETPRYHGRDIAIYLGFQSNATVILGSATPSLETCFNVSKGKYQLLSLPKRVQDSVLPQIHLLDLKHSQRQKGCYFFTIKLVEGIRQRLQNKEQCLLFLNRRGFASLVKCEICDEVITCSNCSLSLIYHQSDGLLKCHQCDYAIQKPTICPSCNNKSLMILGIGTEQIETDLKTMFPDARILRMDRDTLSRKFSLTNMLTMIRNQEVDIIIGTQLVTKGHDFHNITLVGVILADLSLNFPDFRSSERTFQILTQVSGRAGRGEKPGIVFIQTYNPQHHSLQCVKHNNFEQFKSRELEIRKNLNIPPYNNLVLILFSSTNTNRVQTLANQFYSELINFHTKESIFLGPIKAPIYKINKRYRWMIILKSSHIKQLHQLLDQIFSKHFSLHVTDRIIVDINPFNFL